jgi:CHAT domain-containing protein
MDGEVTYADAESNLANIHISLGHYLEARPYIEHAITIYSQFFENGSEQLAVANGNLGIVLFNLKEDTEAEALLNGSLNDLEQLQDIPYDYYNILYNYSSLKAVQGDYRTALDGYVVLEEGYAYDAPNYDYGAILIKVGDALDNLGQFEQASKKYELALSTLEAINETESDEYTIAENNLSLDLQRLGKFDEARSRVESVLNKRKDDLINNPQAFAITATNYANILILNGEWGNAKDQLDQVVQTYSSQQLSNDLTLVNALELLSLCELHFGNFNRAKQNIENAIDIADKEKFSGRLYALNNQKAKVLVAAGDYKSALQFAELALEMALDNYGDRSLQSANVENNLAGIYTELGMYDKASNTYLSSLKSLEKIFGNSHPEYATAAANYSSLLQLTGDYYRAELYLKDAVKIKKASIGTQSPDYLTTYENLALLYSATARYTESVQILEEIKSRKEAFLNQNDPSLANTYSNLANVKKQLAQYPEAESLFRKSLDIYTNSLGQEHIRYANTTNNLALLYQKMGNVSAARPLFEQAMSIYEKELGKLSPDYATVLENLATLSQMEGDNDRAKELLEEALSIDEQILGLDHPLYSKTLHNLASIYEEDEEYERARELFKQSLTIDEKVFGTNHPTYAGTLYNLAVLEQALNNLGKAQELYQQVADIRLNILGEDHPDYAYSVYGLASIARKRGDYETARDNYQIVIKKYLDNIEEYFPALSESEKSAFYGKIRPVFEAFMDFAIEYVVTESGTQQDRDEILGQLYNLQLSTKALLLNASNKIRNRILNSGDTELIDLFQEWIVIKENIVKSISLSKEEIEENGIDIAAMISESNDLEKQLSLKSSEFAQGFETSQITWQNVKEKLTDSDLAIEILRIRKDLKNDSILYAVLILDSDVERTPDLVLFSNGDVLEDKGFKTYKNSIIYKLPDKRSFNLFWKQVNDVIPDRITNIYLSADGVYNKVNLATLLDPETDEYVVEKYNIRLLSNTRELVEDLSSSTDESNAWIFGYPKYNIDKVTESESAALVDQGGMRYSFGDNVSELPGTLTEIQNISKILENKEWQYDAYLEVEASESNVKKLNNPKIFHVATHGFFLEDINITDDENEGLASRNQKYNPLMRAGLLFAGAENTIREEEIPGEEDGILTAYEAMNLNLDKTDLVVMSACETGLGEVKNGEGVYGLQRAFMVAGAKNLIMSLWKVNDETTQLLMSSFYNEWFSGKSRTEAFQNAIAKVKSDYEQPYYWGAFVMLGK